MLRSVYPVIFTEKLEESSLFYKTIFGFTEAFSSDWYVSLSHPDGCELALIDAQHETIPEPNRKLVQGMILNIEVDNATQMFTDISDKSEKIIIMPLQDEAYGQRHFMVQDPNNVIIDIIESIPPSEEYQDSYHTGEN
ncbi:MAG: VOC family protein [Lachnospiraceae bacterium]